MTITLHDHRQNLAATREKYGRRSSHTQRAFEALVRAAADQGVPLDGLRHHTENEVERFFSYTIPGVDGHVYWDGPKRFTRNDGKDRAARRWWFEMHNDLSQYEDLVVKCGEPNCINFEHAAKERVRGTRMHWTHERIIGAMQVAFMRLGHTPNGQEWDRLRFRPTGDTVRQRFGTWEKACESAGLPQPNYSTVPKNHDEVLKGIQLVRDILGHWPREGEYRLFKQQLKEAGLPASVTAARRLYGTFVEARLAAGEPDKQREGRPRVGGPSPSRRGSLRNQRKD